MFNNFLLYNIKLINYSNKTVCREKCTSIRVCYTGYFIIGYFFDLEIVQIIEL